MSYVVSDGPLAGTRRIERWAGEVRVNLIRLAALITFYGYHLLNVFQNRRDPDLAGPFHLSVTALVMVWSTGVMVLYLALSRRWAPPALKYVVTAWDTVLLTSLLMLAGGPQSPLVILYFLIIAAAPLRLSVRLVYVSTVGAIAAYLFLVGHYAYYVIGVDRYYASPELRIPRTQQVIFVLGLGAAGILAGQVVRQANRLVQGYPVAVETPAGEAPNG
jgi:hypothetical protein